MLDCEKSLGEGAHTSEMIRGAHTLSESRRGFYLRGLGDEGWRGTGVSQHFSTISSFHAGNRGRSLHGGGAKG